MGVYHRFGQSWKAVQCIAVLVTLLGLVLVGAPPQAQAQTTAPTAACPAGVRQRKEFRQLTSDEWNRFVNAVRVLRSGTAPTRYDRLVNIHLMWQTDNHNYPPYFVWHRRYLRQFEMELQTIDPNIMVPYWDWSFDGADPFNSPIFTNAYMGGNGVGTQHTVVDGPFANSYVFYPTPHRMGRNFQYGARFLSKEAIRTRIAQSTSYDVLRNNIEYYAGASQVAIGADWATMAGPNDPLNFLHMAYVDKIYSDWQIYARSAGLPWNAYNGKLRNGQPASLNDVLQPWTTRVGQVVDTTNLCYTYKPFP